MKKIFGFSLISVIFLSLIFPSGNVFSSSANAAQRFVDHQPNKVSQLVTVALAQPTAKVTAANFSAIGECKLQASQGGDLLQDVGMINLNQPANCFSLKVNRQTYEPVQLSVMPLNFAQPQLVVVYHGPFITLPALTSGPINSQTPVLPVTTVGLLAGFALVYRRNILKSLNAKLSLVRQSLSLEQLSMLRC